MAFLLEKNINASGTKIKIINAGISGDTTSGGLYRLPKLINAHIPDLIILELGGNDGLRGMSIKKVIKKNLEKMINMSLESGAEVMLIGVELPLIMARSIPTVLKICTMNLQQNIT